MTEQQTRKGGSYDALQLEAVRFRASRSGHNASAYQISAQSGNEWLSYWKFSVVSRPFSEGFHSEPLILRVGWIILHQICRGHRKIIDAVSSILYISVLLPRFEMKQLKGSCGWKMEAKFRTLLPGQIRGGMAEISEWSFQAQPRNQPLIYLWRGGCSTGG